MDAKVIGEHIRKYRKERRMTQRQLAESLFVSAKTISRWELGNGLPDIEELPRIAALLNISIDCLVGNEAAEEKTVKSERITKKKKSVGIVVLSSMACVLAVMIIVLFSVDAFTPFYAEQTYVFEAEESVFTAPFDVEQSVAASGKAVAAKLYHCGESLFFPFVAERSSAATLGISLTRTFSFTFEDKFELFVNGVKEVVGVVPGLGWDGDEKTKYYNFGEPLSIPVVVKKGDNRIEIRILDGLNVNFDKLEIKTATRLFSKRKKTFVQAEDAKTSNCRFSVFRSDYANGGQYVGEWIRPKDDLPGVVSFTVVAGEKVYLPMEVYVNRPYTAVFENKFNLCINGKDVIIGRKSGSFVDGGDKNACFTDPYVVWIMLKEGENTIDFSFTASGENFDGISFTTSADLSFLKKR